MIFALWFLLSIQVFIFSPRLQATLGGSFNATTKSFSQVDNTSFYLEKLTFDSDVPFRSDEFNYLVNLEPQTFINKADVHRAYRNLMRKNRFNNINIDVHESSKGKHLHFNLEGLWLLRDVRVTGFLFGKYEYGAQYLQQPGDIFDINLHEESIKELEKYIKDQGYFNGSVSDELDYDSKNKTILVKLHFKHGPRYKITSTSFIKQCNRNHSDLLELVIANTKKQFPSLKKEINHSKQGKKFYTKSFIQKVASYIKSELKKLGFEQPIIKYKKIINDKTRSIDIIFSINTNNRRIVKFSGNKTFTDNELKDLLLITEGTPNWLFSPDIIREQIVHEYERRGFLDTAVEHTRQGDTHLFAIKESSPKKLESIVVKHAQTLEIEDVAYLWQQLLDMDYFDQGAFDQKLQEFKSLYEKNGYWDFSIVDQQIQVNSFTGKLVVTLFIHKGIQRIWGGFTIQDHIDLNALPSLKKFILRNEHQYIPFDKSWLAEQKSILINAQQQKGYWYADAKFDLTKAPLANAEDLNKSIERLHVTWIIEDGPLIAFGKITLRGNTKLPFSRIKNEVKFKEGEAWNKEKINLTRKKLKRLDIFKRVQIQPLQNKSKTNKPILITLADDDPFEVRLRAGIYVPSNSTLFREEVTGKIGGSFVMKNPTNRADRILLESDLSKFERKMNIEYQQPSLLNMALLGKFKIYANKFIHPLHIASSLSAYQADQIGGLVALSDEYKDHYFWGINIGNEWVKTSNVTGNIGFDPMLLNRFTRYIFVEPSLIIDHLDDKINTSRGSFSLASCKFMLPTQITDYSVKLTLEQSGFYPIFDDIILAARVRFGHIFRKRFEGIMPIERFFLGGQNSVRGYEKDSVPPIGTSTSIKFINGNPAPTTEYTIQGGSSMLNTNLEVRFPIMQKILNGVIFQDLGALSQSGIFNISDNLCPSTGFGLRLKTPVGPLRFDIGWRWKKRFKDDGIYAWYLTLGEAF